MSEPLTDNERDVVLRLGRGDTYKEVGEALRLSVNAVAARAGRAYAKLRAQNCREAIVVLRRMERKKHLRSQPAAEQLPLAV